MLSERYVTFGREKLLALAEMLETVELPGRFDMGNWWIKRSCGTAGCAIGWGVSLGVLPELVLKRIDDGLFSPWNDNGPEEYFGLSTSQTDHLFMPWEYEPEPTRQEVATRIRQFVASHE